MAGHLLKTQLLEPHWEKKAGRGDRAASAPRCTASSSTATGACNFGRVDPAAAREIFIREALVERRAGTRELPFLAHNRKLIARGARSSSTRRAGRTCWSTTS
ncbi:MAG: DUF3418 domain-containing protein [Comamonadaceae bacterium]|nr:DUF3418 domain-containing protein [Comamonadaceae bacterium]